MNREIKAYVKRVKRIIPFYSKDKKEFIILLEERINEYVNENNKNTYQDIVDEFGMPNEVAGSYIESLKTDYILKQLNKKRILKVLVSVIIVLALTVWGFEMYRLNQLYEEVKDSIHGYYEESIEYIEEDIEE